MRCFPWRVSQTLLGLNHRLLGWQFGDGFCRFDFVEETKENIYLKEILDMCVTGIWSITLSWVFFWDSGHFKKLGPGLFLWKSLDHPPLQKKHTRFLNIFLESIWNLMPFCLWCFSSLEIQVDRPTLFRTDAHWGPKSYKALEKSRSKILEKIRAQKFWRNSGQFRALKSIL